MGKIFIITIAVLLVTIWLGFLIPQYAAWKNKRYKTVAICLGAFAVSVSAFVGMVIYGDFIAIALHGRQISSTAQTNEAVLCVLGLIWVIGHWFCWWYIYGRKSLDFIHIKGHTADDLDQILSVECKKLLHLK